MSFQANTVAALIRRTAGDDRDEFGVQTLTETATAVAAIWAPAGSTETTGGEDQLTWQDTLYLPTGTDISAIDAVIPQTVVDDDGALVLDTAGRAQGDRFKIDGRPESWPAHPSGWQPDFSVVVKLKRVTG